MNTLYLTENYGESLRKARSEVFLGSEGDPTISSTGSSETQSAGAIQIPEPKTWEQALDVVLAQVRKTMIARHRKYGPQNIAFSGETGIAVRLGDKAARLLHSGDHEDESREDAYVDAAGYGCIGLMWRHGCWFLPMEGE